jgi:hypothetical protein
MRLEAHDEEGVVVATWVQHWGPRRKAGKIPAYRRGKQQRRFTVRGDEFRFGGSYGDFKLKISNLK